MCFEITDCLVFTECTMTETLPASRIFKSILPTYPRPSILDDFFCGDMDRNLCVNLPTVSYSRPRIVLTST